MSTSRRRRSDIPVIDDDIDPYTTVREFKVPLTFSKDISPDRFTEINKDAAEGKFLEGWGHVQTRKSLSLKEEEVVEWIEQVTRKSVAITITFFSDTQIPANNTSQLIDAFSDGRILCKLIYVLAPGKFKKMPPNPMERMDAFLEICGEIGVTKDEFFNPYDLVNKRSFVQVVYCLHSLAEHCHRQKRAPFFTGASRAVRNKKRLIFESDPPQGFPELPTPSSLDDSMEKEPESSHDRRSSRRSSPSRRHTSSRIFNEEESLLYSEPTNAEYAYEERDITPPAYFEEPEPTEETIEAPLVQRTIGRIRASTIQLNNRWQQSKAGFNNYKQHTKTKLSEYWNQLQTKYENTRATSDSEQTIIQEEEEDWKSTFTKLIILWLLCVLLWSYFWKINQTNLF